MASDQIGEGSSGIGLFVPGRRIAAPSTVSPEAQIFLNSNPEVVGDAPLDADNKAAWRAYINETDAKIRDMLQQSVAEYPAHLIEHDVSSVSVFEIAPLSMEDDTRDTVILYVHGGAFVFGAGISSAYMALPIASKSGIRTFAVDYRMPPDHPYPVGLDDVVEAYRWLLESRSADKIAVIGNSAGGGLAAAFLLKARDIGLPLPAACVLATPEVDLTESGDTFSTNDTIDVVLKHRLSGSISLYAGDYDLTDPYLSPIFAEFGSGFPPTLLLSGTRDLFLSNTVIMHRRLLAANVDAELHVWEAMPHGGFFGAPEDQEVLSEQVRFLRRRLASHP